VNPNHSWLVDPREAADLAARYGEPIRWSRRLDVSPKMMDDMRKRTAKRRGEAVLVIPRPGRRVLLHTKEFYPAGAFRLLSGGIGRGERVENAARREIAEETGLPIAPQRFLGLVRYEFHSGSETVPFASYIFLTDTALSAPRVSDLHERIKEFRDADWGELPQVAEYLEGLGGEWRDWGRFRAVPHRLVIEARGEWENPAL
jgi:8-oxo-dGTP pyrophosphatase MutT (NUDIX family)